MIKIKDIKAREILDSRGNPTVEVDLMIDGLGVFRASAPSGASVGKYEAKELRDREERYKGKGVLKAIKNIDEAINPKLRGIEISNQKEIDEILISLDGTKDKSNLGANAILPVSMAVCRAGAANIGQPLWQYINQISEICRDPVSANLPIPCFNIINGGAHAGNNLDFQEFMIGPQFEDFSQNLQVGSEIYHTLKEILKKDFGESAINVGDEGGFAPPIKEPEKALDLIMEAIQKSGYENKVNIALDEAASEFYKDQKYRARSCDEMVEYYLELIEKYPITSIEDPFDEDDFEGFSILTNKCGDKVSIIGDDLLVTNIEKMKQAQEKRACNGLLLKVNQIGTITETIEAAKLAQSYDWKIMVSHRSGETNDDFIADLAVGISADYIKSGAPARGERVAKYNRLLKIEQELWRN